MAKKSSGGDCGAKYCAPFAYEQLPQAYLSPFWCDQRLDVTSALKWERNLEKSSVSQGTRLWWRTFDGEGIYCAGFTSMVGWNQETYLRTVAPLYAIDRGREVYAQIGLRAHGPAQPSMEQEVQLQVFTGVLEPRVHVSTGAVLRLSEDSPGMESVLDGPAAEVHRTDRFIIPEDALMLWFQVVVPGKPDPGEGPYLDLEVVSSGLYYADTGELVAPDLPEGADPAYLAALAAEAQRAAALGDEEAVRAISEEFSEILAG